MEDRQAVTVPLAPGEVSQPAELVALDFASPGQRVVSSTLHAAFSLRRTPFPSSASPAMQCELRHLTHVFHGGTGAHDVSVTVPRTAIYALCGANGAGKTTTLSVLAGHRIAHAGTLRLHGEPVRLDRHALRPGLSFMADEPVMDLALTAWQWASFVASIKQVPWPADAMDCAAHLQLTPANLDAPLRTLSFGTRRKVALWVEFQTTSGLLVLDEPLIGLDPAAIRGFHLAARSFIASGRSVLLSTHLLREADAVATHVGVMRAGVTLADGAVGTVCAGRSLHDTFFAYVSDTGDARDAAVRAGAAGDGGVPAAPRDGVDRTAA